jgi:cell division protein FtsQ
MRRFTKRARNRKLKWAVALSLVAVTAAVTLLPPYTAVFAVDEILVKGASTDTGAAVQAALSDQLGRPMGLVSESEVRGALSGIPWVESVTLEARPLHTLVVNVVERTPVGVIVDGTGFDLVDVAGVVLTQVDAPGPGQPELVVPAGVGSASFRAAGDAVRSLPESLRAQLTKVAATGKNDVTLTLATGATVVWGDATDSPQKALVLQTAIEALPSATYFDVSSPESLVSR